MEVLTMEPTRTPKLATYLVTSDATGLIRFIEGGIGGKLSYHVADPQGRVVHAEVRVADSLVMIGEQPPGRPLFPAMLHLYVSDANAACDRAVQAGATLVRAPETAADGDRRGGVRDPYGNEWWFTTPPK
jgi:PhnB protein